MSSRRPGFGAQQGTANNLVNSTIKHKTRLEPQGQETNQTQIQDFSVQSQRYSSNNSSDSTRYGSGNRSLSEVRNSILAKEVNSNRSSLDISTCSYNTLIIHNDENMYALNNREYNSSPTNKKDRPRSYGEQGMQEITEIPDDYLSQSHVLKHLAKEIKIPMSESPRSVSRDSTVSNNTDLKNMKKFHWDIIESESCMKLRSKSQPDLTKYFNSDNMEVLTKENAMLKQQLLMCRLKVAKTQKLEDEVTNIYGVYEELVQSCERREKLERVARLRLQENLQKVQTLNRALKDQVDIFQTQLLAPSEHQILIAQLFTQNKDLLAAKERQDIELAAQQATLQEQRTHIGILDTALNNAQRNIRRLEEELCKKQLYVERINQMHGTTNLLKKNEPKFRLDYDPELMKESNRSGNSDSKWQHQDKNNQYMRLESEQRQNSSKLSLERTHVQETDKIIADAKNDKLRYLEDVLQVHLKGLETRLAEKDALIRTLQNQKICGSSFDSYNISTDNFALNPLRFNSPCNVSNTSFNTTLLDQSPYSSNSAVTYNQGMSNVLAAASAATNNFGQNNTPSNYNPNMLTLQNLSIPGNYSPNSSGYSTSFDHNTNFIAHNSPTFNQSSSSYDNQYDEHMKKQIDEQLNKFETLQRGLCCFPSLSNKKPNQSLLSDEVSVLSTNNSDAFLQKLAHLDQREREKCSQELQNKNRNTEEIVLLEKQGRCSQKLRCNATSGNLAQVTQNVGQNMTDISNIESNFQEKNNSNLTASKERGNSLPPSALPRPPRSLKPPRKLDYRFATPTTSQTTKKAFDSQTSSLKRDYSSPAEFSQIMNNYQHSEVSPFSKNGQNFTKDYGTIKNSGEMKNFSFRREFLKSDFKKYKRLEDTSASLNAALKFPDSSSFKLSNTRKFNMNNASQNNNSRDSYNLNDSNTNLNMISSTSTSTTTTVNSGKNSDSCAAQLSRLNAKTPLKYLHFGSSVNTKPNIKNLTPTHGTKLKSNLPVPTASSIATKHSDIKNNNQANSLSRNNENRYRIQF